MGLPVEAPSHSPEAHPLRKYLNVMMKRIPGLATAWTVAGTSQAEKTGLPAALLLAEPSAHLPKGLPVASPSHSPEALTPQVERLLLRRGR